MFEKIALHTPRTFVPADLNPGDWATLAPLFDQLERQLNADDDAAQLEQAILDWEELSAAIAEESSKRYIAMTCQTDDKTAEQAHLDFIEKIEPDPKDPLNLSRVIIKPRAPIGPQRMVTILTERTD